MTNSHRPCLIVSPIIGLEAFAGEFPTSPIMLVLAVDELKWLVSVAPLTGYIGYIIIFPIYQISWP